MHIELRNAQRQRLFAVEIDPDEPPAVVRPPSGDGAAVHLDWDRAIDDEHHLRRCPACGCPELFAAKQVPQITAFVLILLAAVIAMVLFGFGHVLGAVVILAVVLAIDAGIYLFARRKLVCYRCRSTFSRLPIARRHPGWETVVAEKYPPAPAAPAPVPGERETAP